MMNFDSAEKKEFVEFLLSRKALKTGDFTTKSGRKTPYFLNFGSFASGQDLSMLASYYAQYLMRSKLLESNPVLFGPAYKGIALSVSCAVELWKSQNKDLRYCFNRKEEKLHGDKGNFVGHQPIAGDELLIIEDVVTAGSTLQELLPQLTGTLGLKVKHVIFAVDRCERGTGTQRASKELEEKFSLRTHSLITAYDIFEVLQDSQPEICSAFEKYLAEYGEQ
jgi:orotate phosphoribosyltransferase